MVQGRVPSPTLVNTLKRCLRSEIRKVLFLEKSHEESSQRKRKRRRRRMWQWWGYVWREKGWETGVEGTWGNSLTGSILGIRRSSTRIHWSVSVQPSLRDALISFVLSKIHLINNNNPSHHTRTISSKTSK